MAWEQLSINRPHLVYIILGGFTSLFMLCSSVIKERLYIGEATVATICGIIFGPHAANLIDPGTWGNTDQITLEFSRIVLVVQCFAVGVELPKAYMERHWRSVTLLLIPVMTFGWLITSVFIWGLIPSLNWLDSLTVAACVTATDPVLASSVVGKGKFAKRVPKHLRDLLSAESGCNDGMAFPFIYLALYLIKYRPHATEVAYHWICFTILYECIFGAFYGFMVGYIARRLIRAAHERDIIDRESFLVFYFVLALFCAGSGSLLGMDDLLVGFACGVGFSNDGWFTEKTEESHVSNVIDLLINLAFFVYFGTIIPWQQYNADVLGLKAWRLVVVALLVLFFRRIPIMLALKPIIPDIKTWREALFAGHFGPIGVGAIFVAILARAELETGETTPLAVLPEPDFPHDNIIELIWPVTSFLVICSILVHGSSVAVFTLGKHINTLTLTMSYTQAADEPSWMDRLPRIASRSKSSMSLNRPNDTESSFDEKLETGALPRNFLRRQREEDTPDRPTSRRGGNRRKYRSSSRGAGGPISQSAIAPRRSPDQEAPPMGRDDSETLGMKSSDESQTSPSPPSGKRDDEEVPGEQEADIQEEGHDTVYEDKEGNVLEVEDDEGRSGDAREKHELAESKRLMKDKDVHHGVSRKEDDPNVDEGDKALDAVEHVGEELKGVASHPQKHWRKGMQRMNTLNALRRKDDGQPKKEKPKPAPRNGPARAYQFGNTIIVEDEDGEVIKKYDIPAPPKKNKGTDSGNAEPPKTRQRMQRMGSYLIGHKEAQAGPSGTNEGGAGEGKKKKSKNEPEDDERIRFTITSGGRRMSSKDFIKEIQGMDPKRRAKVVEESDVPETVKEEARADAREHDARKQKAQRPQLSITPSSPEVTGLKSQGGAANNTDNAAIKRTASHEDDARGPEGLTLVDSNEQDIPFHDVTGDLHRFSAQGSSGQETAAQRRRREARARSEQQQTVDEDSEDDGTARVPPRSSNQPVERGRQPTSEAETAAERRRREDALGLLTSRVATKSDDEDEADATPVSPSHGIRFANEREGETAAERRRREGALGHSKEDESDSEEDVTAASAPVARPGIRFADVPSPSQARAENGGSGRRGMFQRKK